MTASGARRISPGVVFLAIALIGSVVFVLYAITVRDTSQIPLLTAGGVVLGIVFLGLALYSLRATWRAGIDGRNGRALGLGVGGGIAAIIGAGCLAGAVILFLLSQPRLRPPGPGARGPLVDSRGTRPPSSRGLGRHPFKVEIRGSNPLGGTPAL